MLYELLKLLNRCKPVLLLINLAFIISVLFIALSCGKRKPPLPPIERISQRVEISGMQRGDNIIVSWTMPARNASEASILNISRADIYRLVETQTTSLTLSEDEFAGSSTLIASLPISGSDFSLKRLVYTDELEFSGQSVRLRYAIRFVNALGQKAAFSNFLIIEPASKVAYSPSLLPPVASENSINLSWNAPGKNVDGSTPANILGYNIYRFINNIEDAKIINSTPVTNTNFSDKLFEFEKSYSYFIRTVSLGNNGEPIESSDSDTISIMPKDNFAPSSPTAVTIAAAPNTLSIFFAVNPEKDIAGYRIYRSNEANISKKDWLLLTPQILKANTFEDRNVESGKAYFYYISAVDVFGNESEPSQVVSETIP